MIIKKIGFKDKATLAKYERNERIHSWLNILVLFFVVFNLGLEYGGQTDHESHILMNVLLVVFILALCVISVYILVKRHKLLKQSFELEQYEKSNQYTAFRTKIDTWTSSILTVGIFALFTIKLIELF